MKRYKFSSWNSSRGGIYRRAAHVFFFLFFFISEKSFVVRFWPENPEKARAVYTILRKAQRAS